MTMTSENGPNKSLPLITSEQLLRQIRVDSWRQSEIWSKRARRWRLSTLVLGTLAMFCAGGAGAVVIDGTLTSTTRTAAVVLAFLGATLSGVAAAAGAPYQAREAALRSDRLAALHRWTWLALSDLPKLSRDEAAHVVRRILDWNDDISGVTAPIPLRQEAGTLSSDQIISNGDERLSDPQWEIVL